MSLFTGIPANQEELAQWLAADKRNRHRIGAMRELKAMLQDAASRPGWIREDRQILARWLLLGEDKALRMVLLDLPEDGPWQSLFQRTLRHLCDTDGLRLCPQELPTLATRIKPVRQQLEAASYRVIAKRSRILLKAAGAISRQTGPLLEEQELDGEDGGRWNVQAGITPIDLDAGLGRMARLGARRIELLVKDENEALTLPAGWRQESLEYLEDWGPVAGKP